MAIIVHCENSDQAHNLLQYLYGGYGDDVVLRAMNSYDYYFQRNESGYCYRLEKEGRLLRMLGHCDLQYYERLKDEYGVTEITSYRDFEAEYMNGTNREKEAPVELLDFLCEFGGV